MRHRNLIVYLAVFLFLPIMTAYPQQGKKVVRIGYFEGGTYFMHKAMMGEIRHDLESMAGDSLDILYAPNGYFSAEWDREICKTMSHDVVRNKNIDIVIAAGPWVIEDLLEAGFDKPIVGICQFDPLIMNLIDSAGKPTFKNLTVNYRPNKLKNDMAALQRLFPSRNVGLLYFPSGDEFEKMRDKVYTEAGKYGAVIHAGKEFNDRKLYAFFNSFSQIRSKIDVLYLPPMWGMDIEQIRNFFWETRNAHIPTFASEGFLLVEKDATASDCFRPYRAMGRFTADKIVKIISGKEPASLPTVFDDREELCLNLESFAVLGKKAHRRDIIDARVVPQSPGDTLTTYTLASAIKQALDENSGYLARAQTYNRAVALAKGAYHSFYPDVEANLSAANTNEKLPAAHYEKTFNHEWETEIGVEQKLFSYPAIKAIDIAKKNISIEKSNLDRSQLDLKLAVALAYMAILENQDKLDAMIEITDRLRLIRDDAETNYRIGLTTRNDTPIAEERLAETEIQMIDIQKELRISKIVFNALVNRPGDDNFVLDNSEFTPETMVALVRRLDGYIADSPAEKRFENYLLEVGIGNSLEMKKTDISIGVQKDLISAHKGRYWPELSLVGRYSYGEGFEPSLNSRHDYWVFGGILEFPIFSDKGNSRQGQALRFELDGLQYRKDSLRFALTRDILSLTSNLIGRMTTLPLNYFSKSISLFSLDTLQSEYNYNKISIFDLISIETNNSNSSIRTVDERYKFFSDYARILNLIGIGYPTAGSPEDTEFYRRLEESIGNAN